jgi:protein involved in polysaccharide export with SLBB domain
MHTHNPFLFRLLRMAFFILMPPLLFSACATHTGVEMKRAGETYDLSTGNQNLLPKLPTEFLVGPGDVFRIDASFQHQTEKRYLLERGDVIQIAFYYDKGEYRIMPGDRVRLNFLADAQLDFETMVRLDGRLTVPKIGDVTASGKTPEELAKNIRTLFKGKVFNPEVTVAVIASNLEPLAMMANEYTILPDGKISIPILGSFDAAGLGVDDLGEAISSSAYAHFHNDFKASVISRNIATQSLERYDRVVTVTPAGDVILPGIGNIRVKGLAFPEIKNHIQNSLQGTYANPVDVSLTLIAAASRSIYVSGQVRIPGVYPLAPDITTLKAIMMAGGATNEGSLSEIVLLHYENDGAITVYVTNLNEVIDQGRGIQDLALAPQDVVYVPTKGVADANLFISQYITRMLPFVTGVNYNYNQNPDLNQ